MKKLALFAGVLFTLSVFTQSCNSARKMQRPQRHPRPPRNMAYVQPQEAPVDAVVFA